MKKTLSLIALASIGAGAILSCQKAAQPEDITPYVLDEGEIAFKASASKAVTEVKTENLTTINVEAFTGTVSTSETEVFNVQFTKQGDGTFAADPKKYWPETDQSYGFYASNLAITAAAAGATVTPTDNNTDVVCAYPTTVTYKTTTDLAFKHIYARIRNVNVKFATGVTGFTLDTISIKLCPYVKGTFALASSNYAPAGSPLTDDRTGWTVGDGDKGDSTDVCYNKNVVSSEYTQSNDVYLVPGDYQLVAKYQVTKTDGGNKYSYIKKQTVNIKRGSMNDINATIPDPTSELTEITFTVTVAAWGENTENVAF